MSRPALIVTVALAAYAVFNIVASIAAAWAWRAWLAKRSSASSIQRARALFHLRSAPAVTAFAVTFVAVVPAFSIFEPHHESERVGPVMLTLAAIAVVQLFASAAIAAATSWRTRAAARVWLHGGMPLDVDPPAGVPAYAIDSRAPIVALVGVFKPRLIAARSVIDACSVEELNAIVAHERGHLHAHDNLKRWLMACAPDALRWTSIHREIAAAWHDAAEDAADDAATTGDAAARVDLAALLVKIARLAPEPAWRDATVSPFVEPGGLNRRVRRLLSAALPPHHGPHPAARAALMLLAAAVTTTIAMRPASLELIYQATEALVRFGR